MTVPVLQPPAAKPIYSISGIDSENQKRLLQEIQRLKAERRQLLARVKVLDEFNNDSICPKESSSNLNDVFDGQMKELFELIAKIIELNKYVCFMEQRVRAVRENGKEVPRKGDGV